MLAIAGLVCGPQLVLFANKIDGVNEFDVGWCKRKEEHPSRSSECGRDVDGSLRM